MRNRLSSVKFKRTVRTASDMFFCCQEDGSDPLRRADLLLKRATSAPVLGTPLPHYCCIRNRLQFSPSPLLAAGKRDIPRARGKRGSQSAEGVAYSASAASKLVSRPPCACGCVCAFGHGRAGRKDYDAVPSAINHASGRRRGRLADDTMDIISRFLRYLFWRAPAPPNRLREVLLNFSVELHKQQLLQQEGLSNENVLSAPFALALALTAAHAGSGQATAAQIAKALHLPEELIEEVRQEFTEMTHRLADCGPDFRIYLANAIFADRSVDVPGDFSDLVETAYDGAVKQVDFRSDPNGARAAINAWVEEKTKCKVTDIIQSGKVDARTSLLLVNAMYFTGFWDSHFNPQYTALRPFHETKDKTSMVEMMYQRKNYKTSCCDKLEVDALEMPYVGKKLSMVILRPQKVDGLDRLEKKLTPELLANLLKTLGEDHDVEIYLPKFKLEHTSSFKGTLETLGVTDLFSDRADVGELSKTAGVRVTAIEHKAVVEVDEDGVEGLFLTPLIMMCYAGVSFNYNVNRPFMFLIRSCDPDVILYIGSVRRL